MYHIMICDDDSVFVEYIEDIILKSGIEEGEAEFYKYSSGEALLAGLERIRCCDLLILDMQMKEMDGHETAAAFRKKFPDSTLAFCSGACFPTAESFLTTPFRYLLKSYTEEKMMEEMKAVVDRMRSNQAEPFLMGVYKTSSVRVRLSDILYIDNARHGSVLHIYGQKINYDFENKIIVKKKLKDLSEMLRSYGFSYAHSSYLVNLRHVIKIVRRAEVKLSDGTKLSVSRAKSKQFREALADWIAGKYKD